MHQLMDKIHAAVFSLNALESCCFKEVGDVNLMSTTITGLLLNDPKEWATPALQRLF